jgi:hypothetical protein
MLNIVLKGNHSSGKTFYLSLLKNRGMIPSGVNLYEDRQDTEADVIIYLYCHPDVCYKRQNVYTREHLYDLHLKYETELDDLNCRIPIYKVNSQEHSNSVLRNLEDILRDSGSSSNLQEATTDEMTDN